MRPVGFCVLVKPDAAKETLKTEKIALPDSVTDKWRIEVNTGYLIAIGNMAWKGIVDGTPWAKVGDHVVYAKYGGKIIEDPDTGEKVILLQDKDIIGVL
jgi:co-chaperonin GroES (HSP10)